MKKTIVQYYPYRKGRVFGIVIPRELMIPFEEALYKELSLTSGITTRPDNHSCFSLIDGRAKEYAVMFTDMDCIIGTSVSKGCYP